MIVVDLGCHDHPLHQGQPQDSIGKLIERFHPTVLYGYDPLAIEQIYRTGGTRVVVTRQAAWTYRGSVRYDLEPQNPDSPLSAKVKDDGPAQVTCFDLADLIRSMPDEGLVVKMDVEGGEYVLIRHLIDNDLDEWLALLLVEWHGRGRYRERRRLEKALRCPVEQWQ